MRWPAPGAKSLRAICPAFLATLALAVVLASARSDAAATSPCASCHADQVAASAAGPHRGVAQTLAFCESCHGDAAKHLQSNAAADILGKAALSGWSAEKRSAACATCHGAAFPGWRGTPHARSHEVSCASCHGNAAHEKAKGTAARGAASCEGCHAEAFADFRRVYHHPVPEGRMACVSCHDVHGRRADGAEKIGARCLSCHAEVAGPYVFPHRALEEGCTACHAPHGSVNRSLLTTSGNGMCLVCHLQSNFPAVGNVPHNRLLQGGGRCLDCHSEVHGSNVDELMAPRYRRR